MRRAWIAAALLGACAPRAPLPPTSAPVVAARDEQAPPSTTPAAAVEASTADGPAPAVAAAPTGSLARVQGVEVARLAPGPGNGAVPGFVWWMGANARLVAIYWFSAAPKFGHHGEPLGDPPTLTLFDTTTGAGEAIDELVASDPRGRWAVIARGKQLWLIDGETGQREELTARGADASGDANRCLEPRQAGFDALGGQLVYLRTGPDRAVIRQLADGSETEVAAGPGRLWRAYAVGAPGSALLFEVPGDSDGDGAVELPVQNTSCACRWCGRFALSHGFYGWSGDRFEFVMVEGGRRTALPGVFDRLADGVFVDSNGALQRTDGKPIALPAGCRGATWLEGSSAVLTGCPGGSRLFWPGSGEKADLPGQVTALELAVVRAPDGGLRAGLASKGGESVLLSVDLARGEFRKSPRIGISRGLDRRGRALAVDQADQLIVFEVASGATRAAALGKVEDLQANWARIAGVPHAVDAGRGLVHALSHEPSAAAENGCALLAAVRGGELETGPWTLRCPSGEPAG
ncbi:MAG: hypothetical protein JNL82_18980 [Myxococcales bacterium]|nr:hypothetical protein [Myxococcales bacterium]